MAGKPLEIPWSNIFSDGDRPLPDLEISSRAVAGGGDREERGVVTNLSDHELRERIERMRPKMKADFLAKLPDKGVKLQALLRELEEERERRGRAALAPKEDAMECGEKTASGSSESAKRFRSESFSKPCSRFASFCVKKLDTKADNQMCSQSREKYPSGMSTSNRSETLRGVNCGGEHNLKVPLRKSSFDLDNAKDNDNQQSPRNNHDIASPSHSELYEQGNIASRVSRRRRASITHEPVSQQLEWVQVKDVVLLDDEDVLQPFEEGKNNGERKEARIYYPSRDHPEFVEIYFSDLQCLDPECYLTSTIMNFYVQYLQNPASQIGSSSLNEYYFFNTYFYQKLEKVVSSKVDKNENFSKLRRWLRGVNIFQKTYIFLPIHGDLHWSLVIICIPAKEDQAGPIILHLDSLGFHASNLIFDNIESYLKEEWKHICENTYSADVPIPEKIWDYLPRFIRRKKIMVPQQKNEYDCGLFVLYFMERFIEEAPERLKSKDLAKFGSKWFQPEEASGLRKKVRDLLLEEFKNVRSVSKESPPESLATSQKFVSLKDAAMS